MRAARGGFWSSRYSEIFWLVRSFQGLMVPTPCQKKARRVVANEAPEAGIARGKFFTSASSVAIWGESHAGGGPGLNWLPDASAQGRQFPAAGSSGFVPRQDRKSTRLNSSHLGISYA